MTNAPTETELQAVHDSLGGDAKYAKFTTNTDELERIIHGIPPAFQKYAVEGSVAPAILSPRVGGPTHLVRLNIHVSELGIPRSGRGTGWAHPKVEAGFNLAGNIYLRSWEELEKRNSYVLHATRDRIVVKFLQQDENVEKIVGVIIARPDGGVEPPNDFKSQGKFSWGTSGVFFLRDAVTDGLVLKMLNFEHSAWELHLVVL
ncbi:hypothetical protein AX16_009458 [Volvariella volvacea WC 439]|nr:hypothetical protein AX16_009458 [Volvariella volvacea WC 439]